METAKLFSSIWKRVTSPPEMVRTIAKGDSMILPVALILVASSPTIAALVSLARISWTSNWTGSVKLCSPAMKSATALRPTLVPIHGSQKTKMISDHEDRERRVPRQS
jgi:hypothetical protein